ncbi:MAG: hypothetical protein DHS20C05_05770 [Hyphococcus sp.]|nr:MAG: hypothetical protein DHS20C05_05770 [Marinicaulis sp.]
MASGDKTIDREVKARRVMVESAITKHDRMLVRWLAQKFGDMDTAKDIAQNAYLRVWRYAEVNNIDNPRALIFKTAANLAANEFRSRRRAFFVKVASSNDDYDALELVATDAPSPERSAVAKQDLQTSMQAISGLPRQIRRAFILSRFMGKSYQEIAKDLGVSESSVEKYIISALKVLREAINQDGAASNVIDITKKVAASRKK